MVSADQSSRLLPSPTVSTLSTGSPGTTTRVSCSLPPLAPRARSAASISPTASAGRCGPGTTVARASAPSPSLTTGTIRTDESAALFGSAAATVTAGDW